jgi:hypothetical protein
MVRTNSLRGNINVFMPLKQAIREIRKLKFSSEQQRQFRNHMRTKHGRPLDPLDMQPINLKSSPRKKQK